MNGAPEEIRTPSLLIRSQKSKNGEVVDFSDSLARSVARSRPCFALKLARCCTPLLGDEVAADNVSFCCSNSQCSLKPTSLAAKLNSRLRLGKFYVSSRISGPAGEDDDGSLSDGRAVLSPICRWQGENTICRHESAGSGHCLPRPPPRCAGWPLGSTPG